MSILKQPFRNLRYNLSTVHLCPHCFSNNLTSWFPNWYTIKQYKCNKCGWTGSGLKVRSMSLEAYEYMQKTNTSKGRLIASLGHLSNEHPEYAEKINKFITEIVSQENIGEKKRG